jgi:hypothetical protein
VTWQLHVRFQEMELRDAYWEQVGAWPHLAPLFNSHDLRARLSVVRPTVVLEHAEREMLARLCRLTLDFWRSAEVSLHRAQRRIENLDEGADIYLETGPAPTG